MVDGYYFDQSGQTMSDRAMAMDAYKAS